MKYINVHTHNSQCNENTFFIKNYFPNDVISPNTYLSIGIHPWHIDGNTADAQLKIMEQHLIKSECLAVGECGLDRTTKIDFLLQKKVFTKQLHLAEKIKKPLIIHCVRAYQEILDLIKREQISVPLIFHGFSKNSHIHSILLKFSNIYFSFGHSTLTSKITQANITATPLDRLFIETDSATIDIQLIYIKIAEIKKISLENLEKQVLLNFEKIFKIDLINDNG